MSGETVSINGGQEIPVDKFVKGARAIAKAFEKAISEPWTNINFVWPTMLSDLISEARLDKDTGEQPSVMISRMDRDGTYLVQSQAMTDIVLNLVLCGSQAYVSFQPAIPAEATQFQTPAPVKTRPLNNETDLQKLADSISMYGGTDFYEWQGTVITESAKAAYWAGFSAALVAEVMGESWAPNVSKGEDGGITMKFGRVQAKATADGMAIKFTGKPENYLSVLRGVFRADLSDD